MTFFRCNKCKVVRVFTVPLWGELSDDAYDCKIVHADGVCDGRLETLDLDVPNAPGKVQAYTND